MYAKFIFTLLLIRFLKLKPYLFIFFIKKPLFYLDFSRFRFKKIKKFKTIRKLTTTKLLKNVGILKELIKVKKNSTNLSLTKHFLKKSLYINKFFNSKRRNLNTFQINKFKMKKRIIFMMNKFFVKYIDVERNFFAQMFLLKKQKQKTITRFTLKLTKQNPLDFKRSLELSLVNILLRSKFCLSKHQAFTLLNLNNVFLNFKIQSNSSYVLKKGDILQVIFHKGFYLYYKYTYNLVFKRISKLNYCSWRIQSSKKRKNKQQIRSYPTWLKSIFFFPYFVPKYLEVDFTCLSAVVLKNPFFQKDFSPYVYWNFNYYLYKLMSWKRIT